MFKCVPELLPVRVTQKQAELLVFLFDQRQFVFSKWPAELQDGRILSRLVRRGILAENRYVPGEYGFTRKGFSLASWLHSTREHRRAAANKTVPAHRPA